MTDELTPTEGMNRREMLKRSALVGGAGALMWAAPSVTTFSSRAFGQTEGTPLGKGLSYIALRYNCGEGDRFIKFDLDKGSTGVQTEGVNYECTTGNFSTPGCPDLGNSGAPKSDADCAKFVVTYDVVDSDNEPVKVTVTFAGAHVTNCIINGLAFGKCGNPNNPQSGGECIQKNVVNASSVTFEDCGN